MTFSSGTEHGTQVSLSKGPSLHLLLNLPLAASGMAHAPSDKTVPRSQSKLVLRIRCCWELFQGRCGDGRRGPVQTDKQGPREKGRRAFLPQIRKTSAFPVLETVTNTGTCPGTSLPCGWHVASGAQLSWTAAGETAACAHPGAGRGVPWCLRRCPAGLRQGAPLPAGSPTPETPARPSFQELAGPTDLSRLGTIEVPREPVSVQGTPAAAPGVT